MNDLPKVFANKIEGKLNNTQELFYSSDRGILKNKSNESIGNKIKKIFSSPNHVYKSLVRITLDSGIKEEVIVGKTNTNLITIKGELIKIGDILDIERL